MSRVMFALAFLLMASTVSAQYNVTIWTNSAYCNGTTVDGAAVNSTIVSVGPTCTNALLPDGVIANLTAVCDNKTGIVTAVSYPDGSCASAAYGNFSNSCHTFDVALGFSAWASNCAIASTPTPTPTPTNNGTNGNSTDAPPATPVPTNVPTNGTNTTDAPPTGTPKPQSGVAQTGLSLIAAAAVIVAAFL